MGEVYNIGGNNEWTNIDIVTLICEQMDKHHPQGAPHTKLITHVTDRLGHDRRYAIDASKIMSELGYKPAETFETGIRKTIQWYLNNEVWWRGILDVSSKPASITHRRLRRSDLGRSSVSPVPLKKKISKISDDTADR